MKAFATSIAVLFCAVSLAMVPLALAQGRHPAPAGHSAPTMLRFTYVPGNHVAYDAVVVQGAPAPLGETTMRSRAEVDTIATTPDGSAQLRMRLANGDIQNALLPASARQQIAQALAGAARQFTRNSRAQVTHRDAVTGVTQQYRQFAEVIMQSIDQMYPTLPDHPISAGGTWTDHQVLAFARHRGRRGSDVHGRDSTRCGSCGRGHTGQLAVIGIADTMSIGGGAADAGRHHCRLGEGEWRSDASTWRAG